MNLFLDIETTGIPAKGLTWEKDYEHFPYVVELAWKMGKTTKRFVIYQQERKIPKEATAVHGITTAVANDKKKTYTDRYVFEQLSLDASLASKIIGHNIYFDTSIIKACVARLYGKESIQLLQMNDALDKSKRVDTMRLGQKLTKKWPTLTELCKVLKVEFKDRHTAEGDVIAVEKCYNKLILL